MTPMMDGPLRLTRSGPVLEVVLDRPKANAIDAATSRVMGECFAAFRDDPALRVAIVTGAGDKFFSAGWDLKEAAQGAPPDSDYGVGGFGGLQQLPNLNKPIIAAVNGMAVGGGFELALSADLIIAADHARFALPEIRAGTLADAATIKLPRRIPYHVAMDMLLTVRWMDAQEAQRWGLLKEIVLFADRSDISEELTRLQSHFQQFADCAKSKEPVGRTLDFLAQEMNREINTIGSKANDSQIARAVVTLKAELEKFREQAQNVE